MANDVPASDDLRPARPTRRARQRATQPGEGTRQDVTTEQLIVLQATVDRVLQRLEALDRKVGRLATQVQDIDTVLRESGGLAALRAPARRRRTDA